MTMLLDINYEMARFCLDRHLIDPAQFKQAEFESIHHGTPPYQYLLNNQLIDDAVVKQTLANFLDLFVVALDDIKTSMNDCLDGIPRPFAIENRIIPFALTSAEMHVAISEPSALRSIGSFRLITGKKIIAFVISPMEMDVLIARNSRARDAFSKFQPGLVSQKTASPISPRTDHQGVSVAKQRNDHAETSELLLKLWKNKPSTQPGTQSEEQGAQIINFVNEIIFDAVRKHASDIHIEMFKETASLRYRLDGVLHHCHDLGSFLFENYSAVTTRIKIMASLDISERRLPQDGAIVVDLPEGRSIDLRVSVLPTVFSERIVMRILDREGISFDLDKLGFPEKEYKDVISAFDASQGMVLVTGPTGSGKSTTLYGALRRLNKPGINILTAEDPVEFTVEGVGQVQIRDDIGLTFAQALRSFLRQDPEVILVGEIRDKDTADISIKAALTGHLVLSTLHANDAISTVVRLVNMGIPGYLIGAALNLVIAQRLARKICPHCKKPHEGNHTPLLLELGFSEALASQCKPSIGAGCTECNHTGYKGRQGIYEALKISDALRAAIIDEKPATLLKEIAHAEGFRRMQDIGQQMVMDGVLSIDEYQRNLIFY